MKIGILLNNKNNVTLFYKSIIDKLSTISGVEIFFIILKNEPNYHKQSFFKSQLPIAIFIRFELLISKISNYPLKYTFIDVEKFKNIIYVENKERFSNYTDLTNDDINELKELNFDIFLRIGWGIIKGDVLNVPKHGIWSLHHGDNDHYRGKPSMFWEYFNNEKNTGAILQKLTNTLDGGEIIDKLITTFNQYYISKGLYELYYKSFQMLIENIVFLQENGHNRKFCSKQIIFTKKIYKNPNLLQQFKVIFKLTIRHIYRFLFVREKRWSIYISPIKSRFLLYKYKKINYDKKFFLADPFLIDNNGKTYVFYEKASTKDNLGHIEFLNCEDSTEYGVALKEDFHLSFPNIITNENNYFMLPETRANNTISLYKCIQFPSKWQLHKVILNNISAVDSDIFFHENYYYLFSSVNNNSYLTDADNLHIYYSDKFDGDYKKHRLNPIYRDSNKSRLAGKIFKIRNSIYRIAQNQKNGYGSGIVIFKIEKLNPAEFSEVLIQEISGHEINKKGIHTLNFSEKYSVIDILE
jgi:hypothetical protein